MLYIITLNFADEYYGDHCEKILSPCSVMKCPNASHCLVVGEEARCVCEVGKMKIDDRCQGIVFLHFLYFLLFSNVCVDIYYWFLK